VEVDKGKIKAEFDRCVMMRGRVHEEFLKNYFSTRSILLNSIIFGKFD